MADEFQLGKRGQFGKIDFSKLKQGLKKEDITGGDKDLESIWAMLDEDGNNVLSRKEIQALRNKIAELAGDDKALSKKEGKKFTDENGEKIGKKGRQVLYELLNKLSEKTADVDNISNNIINGKECQIVKYKDSNKTEYLFDDGSKIVEEGGTKTHYDKDGNVTKTEVKDSDQTTVKEFENGKLKREEITKFDGCREVSEFENGEIKKKTKSTPTGDKFEEIIYKDGKPSERTVIETVDGNKTKKIYDGESEQPHTVIKNYGEKGNQITTKNERTENGRTETVVEEAQGRESKTNFNNEDKRTSQVVKTKNGKTYTVKYDGKGNTFVVVQYGETIDSIAAKFGCDKQAIIDLNGGKTKFTPGDEILIPNQLEADTDVLRNRKSATEARAEYNKAVEAARKKREAAAAEARRKAEAEAAAAEERRRAEEAEAAQEAEPSYSDDEIKVQKESAKQIVNDLKKAIRGLNDHDAINKALARIDHPVELEEVNKLLAAEGYEANDMYSAVEKFINQELQRVETDYSCEELETLVQNWIDKGLLKGQAAIDAQARLAARVICDGGDGFGTDPDKIKKGIYMIKAPAGQGSEAAKKVYEQVNKIIANHNTFYGIGTKCKDLKDYLKGELWDDEIKYLDGILAENDAIQGTEKAEAVSGLVEEAVDGAGTDIDALKQAIKAIKTPEDRKAVEEKLAEYCEKKGIKPQIDGQSALQAIMYTECDTFMGFSTDHAEIRKFNEMLIAQGAYSEQEAVKIRAEQAALQILEGDFDNIQDAVKNIKDKEVLAKLDELLKTKGYEGLDDFLNKNLVQTDMDLVNAELASNNLLSNDKAADVAFRLVQNSDFDTRAMGLKAIRNEQVAKLVDAKLKEKGSSLSKIYEQFNKEKAEYKSKAALWDGLAIVFGSWAEEISDQYRENTDVSDNVYVEADNAVELTPEQQQAYEMTIQVFEEKLEEMIKAYEEALESQGLVSDAVNAFCERWNLGTTRDEIEARIEHDKETLRLLKLAASGKLAKVVDGQTVSVSFEDVFKERQAEKVTANGAVVGASEVNKDFEFSADKVAAVAAQAERMGAMNHMKDTIAACWADLELGIKDGDQKRLAVGIFNTLKKLGELNGSQLSLESYGYKLNDEGIIVDSKGFTVPPQDLIKIVDQLKSGLAEMANNIFGKGITTDMNADSVKSLLDEGYEEEIEKFKQEYREAFNQEPTDEMVDKYIETINTGKTVVNFAVMIGAAVLAPLTGGGSLAVFAAVAGSSMALNAAEKSTDADGYTNLEWTSDAEQAIWDGVMTATGMKVGQFAEKFARGALNIKAAQSLLAKNKSVLSTMIKNPATLEKAAIWVARVEAAGFEVTSDTLQSLVQMYCQEGEFNEEAFLQGLIMSVAGNAVGHVVDARADIKAVDTKKPVGDLSTTEMIKEYENIPDNFDSLPETERAAAQQRAAELLTRMTKEGYVVQGQIVETKVIFEKMIATSDDMSKVRAELANNPEFQKLSQQEQLDLIGKINKRDAELQAIAAKKQADEANTKTDDVTPKEEVKQTEETKPAQEAKPTEETKKARKEEIKTKVAELASKYGQKAANAYGAVLRGIDSLRTQVDLDKLIERVNKKFADLGALKTDLMSQLRTKADNLKLKFNEYLDDIKSKKTNSGAQVNDGANAQVTKKSRRAEIKAEAKRIATKYGQKAANAYGAVLRGIDSLKNQVDLDKLIKRINKKFESFSELKTDLMAKLKAKAQELKLKIDNFVDSFRNIDAPQSTVRANADIKLTANNPVKVNVNTKIRLADHVDIDLKDLENRFKMMPDGDSFYIGRTVTGPNDIQINNPYISGKHIKVEKINGEIYITDVGSTNGTILNTTKPDYAAQWKPDTAGKYANAKANDFYNISEQYYDDLRRANYSYEESVNKNIRQSDVMPDDAIIKNNNIIGYPSNGWFWRSPRRVGDMAKLDIVDRISLNVKADKKMLEELDNLMQNGTYVNKQGKTVKVEVPQGYYKTPQTLTKWGNRHDPITMYFDKKISDELAEAIADITEKYARTPSNGKALMNSLPGKPWIAHEEYIPVDKAKALFDEAMKLNPELANGIASNLGKHQNWNCSTGMYAAAKRTVDEYKLSLGKPANLDGYAVDVSADAAARRAANNAKGANQNVRANDSANVSNPHLDKYTRSPLNGQSAPVTRQTAEQAKEFYNKMWNQKYNQIKKRYPNMPENQIRQAATDYANDLYPRTQAEWEHFAWTKSRPDLFDEAKMHDYNAWTGYDPVNQKHGPWKMHLFSVSEADWRDMCDVIIPYLKEHDIEWKTFNSGYTPEKLTGNQNGKAFTIYPRDNAHMAQVAKDLEYIIKKNKLERTGSHIVGDNQMGSTGRLFYRYEFNSGRYKDDILDLANPNDNAKYHQRYDSNRGEGQYLARDMRPEDDIWRNFDPSDPNSYPEGVDANNPYAREAEAQRQAADARQAEEAKRVEEARKAEEVKKAEEAKRAEEARKAQEAKKAEEVRKAKEAEQAEAARRAQEARHAEAANKASNAEINLTKGTPVSINGISSIRLANKIDIDLRDLEARFDVMQDGDSFYIGRTVTGPNDIRINNEYVSGKHLKIEKRNGQIYITDVGSTNGTILNTIRPDYAAKWDPYLKGKYANTSAYEFNKICDQYYDDLRLANYSFDESVAGNITAADIDYGVQAKYARTQWMSGWSLRVPNRCVGMSANVVDRISLNVVADKNMLEELDKLLETGTYVNKQGKTVTVKVPDIAEYKTPATLEKWGNRHDPITMYFGEKISDELQDALAEITEKYARKPSNGKALMNALPGKPWIAHEEYIPVKKAQKLYAEAEDLNPELARGISEWLGADDGSWNCSTGMYAAAEKMVNEYKLSMGKADNLGVFIKESADDTAAQAAKKAEAQKAEAKRRANEARQKEDAELAELKKKADEARIAQESLEAEVRRKSDETPESESKKTKKGFIGGAVAAGEAVKDLVIEAVEDAVNPIEIIKDELKENIVEIANDVVADVVDSQPLESLTGLAGALGSDFLGNPTYNDIFDNIPDNNDQNFIDFGA